MEKEEVTPFSAAVLKTLGSAVSIQGVTSQTSEFSVESIII